MKTRSTICFLLTLALGFAWSAASAEQAATDDEWDVLLDNQDTIAPPPDQHEPGSEGPPPGRGMGSRRGEGYGRAGRGGGRLGGGPRGEGRRGWVSQEELMRFLSEHVPTLAQKLETLRKDDLQR